MLELFAVLVFLGLGIALLSVIGWVFQLVFTVLFWPFQLVFWALGGVFKLVLLPFQIVGGLLLALFLLPLLILGVPLLLAFGIPIFAVLFLTFCFWIVGGLFCAVGSAIFGWC